MPTTLYNVPRLNNKAKGWPHMTQFIFPVKVYIEDTDYSGLVFHANYLNYFERARSESAEKLQFGIE